MSEVFCPDSISAALRCLDQHRHAGRSLKLLAGGTDVYPAHVGRPIADPVLDLSAVATLREIAVVSDPRTTGGGASMLRLGAMTTWSDLCRRVHPALCHPALDALVMAAMEVGGVQIQNRGTLAGNLCNASPAADGVPPLLALDAVLELASSDGVRYLPLEQFILGPRKTALHSHELVAAVLLPNQGGHEPPGQSHSAFCKLGQRRYLVISAVMVAVRLDWADDVVTDAAVAVGSCGPVALRLGAVETLLRGQSPSQVQQFANRTLALDHVAALSPIDDVRGTAGYRIDMAVTVIGRMLALMAAAPGQSVGPRNAGPRDPGARDAGSGAGMPPSPSGLVA